MTAGDREPELRDVFAAELLDRITWFVSLRWIAAIGVLCLAVAAPFAGLPASWGSAWIVAVLVLAYNVWFAGTIGARNRTGRVTYDWLASCTLIQIVVDLAALLLLILMTGGITSPFAPFLVFHMVIGTIMLSARTMILIALAVWAIFAGTLLVHPTLARGAVSHATPAGAIVLVLAIGATLILTVSLTDTVASRFKQRGVTLFRLTGELRDKTTRLETLLEELRAVEQRKSHFMLLSAHQLRSPLGTVKTSLDVLRQGYVDPSSARGERLLTGASERIDGLLAIVNDLLELAKAREGRDRAPWAANLNLKQLLLDVLDEFAPVAEERRIRVTADLADNAILARGIPPDLVYALENLVDNAIKYSDAGGEITVTLQVRDGEAIVLVSDRGIGIPAEFQPSLFSEFSRGPNARAHTPVGTGLGLAIVREVAAAHGGAVNARSQPGHGSTFELRLPLDTGQPVTAS